MPIWGAILGAVVKFGKVIVGGLKTAAKFVVKHIDKAANILDAIDGANNTSSNQPAEQTAAEKVARQRSYDAQAASIDESKQLDQILQQERNRRKPQIDRAEECIREAMEEILVRIKADIAQFEQFGLKMNHSIVEQQFELLEQGETLVSLVNRRYSLSDAECLEILAMSAGEAKKQRMKQFGREIMLKGGKKYFDRLSQTCDVVFNYIDDAAGRHTATQNAEMKGYAADIANFSQEKEEYERQKTQKYGRLQKLESLEKLFVLVWAGQCNFCIALFFRNLRRTTWAWFKDFVDSS